MWEGRSSTYDHGASRFDYLFAMTLKILMVDTFSSLFSDLSVCRHDRGRVAYDAVNERVRFTDEIDVSAPGR